MPYADMVKWIVVEVLALLGALAGAGAMAARMGTADPFDKLVEFGVMEPEDPLLSLPVASDPVQRKSAIANQEGLAGRPIAPGSKPVEQGAKVADMFFALFQAAAPAARAWPARPPRAPLESPSPCAPRARRRRLSSSALSLVCAARSRPAGAA